MTNIERIRMARQEMDETFKRLIKDSHGQSSVGPADLEVLQHHVIAMIAAQGQALVQATQVADENFDRAQKLSEQVQENVKHIERLEFEPAKHARRLIEQLKAENEDLRKDAERYRWLRDKAHTADWEFIGGQTPDAGEAEIDAAMAKESK